MASLKNSVKRREHKERSQPSNRKRYGLLEKKKDYKKRAEDFQRKQRTIKELQGKAAERNPDEFYFAMQNTSTKDGVHIARTTQANKYTKEELAMMRTQDSAYLRSKAQAQSRKEARLQSELHCLGTTSAVQHTVFVDSERQAAAFDPEAYFDTDAALLPRTFNRPRRSQAGTLVAAAGDPHRAAKVSSKVHAQYKELLRVQQVKTLLLKAAHGVDQQRALVGKGAKRKVSPKESGLGEAVYRWRTVRKK
eukprot:jgi/Ulvmu1/9720/UM055_0058.1